MPEKTTAKEIIDSKWSSIEDAQNLAQALKNSKDALIKVPDKIDLKLKSGFFFGIAMGIGFCLGFLISLMILLGGIAFYVYAKFPQLFN